jgi:hypothetical protein
MFSSNSAPFKFAQNQSAAQVVLKENNKQQNKQKQAKKSSGEPKLKVKTSETVPVNIYFLFFYEIAGVHVHFDKG